MSSGGDICYIQGYLFKRTRDGRWQKRWFETTGCFLTYYKSKKMTKLLAALNLPQVGDIKLHKSDEDPGCLFSIHLNDRDYLLKAQDAASAKRWVSVLNQLKEQAKPEKKIDKQPAWRKQATPPAKKVFCCCITKSNRTNS